MTVMVSTWHNFINNTNLVNRGWRHRWRVHLPWGLLLLDAQLLKEQVERRNGASGVWQVRVVVVLLVLALLLVLSERVASDTWPAAATAATTAATWPRGQRDRPPAGWRAVRLISELVLLVLLVLLSSLVLSLLSLLSLLLLQCQLSGVAQHVTWLAQVPNALVIGAVATLLVGVAAAADRGVAEHVVPHFR